MQWSTVHFHVRTPLFSGTGPGQQLSIPGIRGALGFWLRALLGAEVGENTETGERFGTLAARQATVLGMGGRNPRCSPVAMRWAAAPPVPNLSEPGITDEAQRVPRWVAGRPGMRYLLGQGLWTHRPATADPTDTRGLQRPWLDAGTGFDVGVRLPTDPASRELFFATLWLLSNFGGLGARTRRGFGQVTLTLPGDGQPGWWDQPARLDDETGLPAALAHLVTVSTDRDEPSYPRFGLCRTGPTALTSHRNIDTRSTSEHDEIHHVHNVLGTRWRAFRADHQSSGERPTRYTTEYRDVIASDATTDFPLANLGLPVVFDQKDVKVNLHHDGKPLRLGSPHWLRPEASGYRMLTFVHTLCPAGAALVASHRPDTPLAGLDPVKTRVIHTAWNNFDGKKSNWR
ncbi:RAMP superfamily CRISPR-associated protein [Amycolatopsis mediterranei]|uniref:RAMP superfamily CRISPR-associated protein n=1 Tax=Amycolatopsis mediterranei TaxID=33910 RepID=UPI00341423D8